MLREYFISASYWLDPFFLIYFGGINLIYLFLLILGSFKVFNRLKDLDVEDFKALLHFDSLPEITFLLAAYNEERNIEEVIDNLLHLTYRQQRIIVVNDGSTDKTFSMIEKKLQILPIPHYYPDVLPSKKVRGVYRSTLYPHVLVIDKENGEKYDALNAGLNLCETPYFITVDADTRIEDSDMEALIRVIETSPKVIATGASVRILNGCKFSFNKITTDDFPDSFITAMQSLEYIRSFLMRQGWDYVGGNYVMSGAFSVFAKDVIVQVGGFAPTVANDLEIILRLNRIMLASKTPYEIVYQPDPVAWTEGPTTRKGLAKQRLAWQRGTLESIWYHKCLLFNPKYKSYGMFVYPFLVFGDVIEPLVELVGYTYIIVGLSVGIIDPMFILFFLCMTWGLTVVFTVFCLFIEELSFRRYHSVRSISLLVFYALLENFGYRQLTLLWRAGGFWSFIKKFSTVQKISKNINQRIDQILRQGKIKW